MREVNAFWKQYYSNGIEELSSVNTEQPNDVNTSIVLDGDDDDDVAIVEEQEDLVEVPVYVMIGADGSCMGVLQAPVNDNQPILDGGDENDNSTGDIIELDDSDDNEDSTQGPLANCTESSSSRADHKCSFCSKQFEYQYV